MALPGRFRRSLIALSALLLSSNAFAQTPPWYPIADSLQTRAAPESVLLNDGRVLVVGGAGFSIGEEIYNPSSNTWSLTGVLSQPGRSGHRLAKLADGRVIVVGGTSQNASTPVTEIFNPATNTWTTLAAAAVGRTEFGLTLLHDGRLLASGGASHPTNTNLNPIASVEIYNPVSNTWSPAAPMSIGRYNHHQVQLHDGRVMVMAGSGPGGTIVNSTEFYDPATNTWSAGPGMKRGRRDFTATLLADGRVVAVGGVANDPATLNPGGGDTAEIFDPATNAWTLVPQVMSVPRREHAATLMYDGKILITSGNNGGVPYQTAELLDPAAGTWTLSTMITGRIFHHSVLMADGRVLVSGGWDQNPFYTKKAEIYGEPIALVADAGADQSLAGCVGCFTQVALDGSASQGAGASTFVWTVGATTLASSSQPTASVLLGIGTHAVTLTITRADGQTDSDTVQITVVDAIAAKDAIIAQLNDQITALNTQIADLTDDVADLTTANAALTTQNTQLSGQVSTLTADNAALTSANQQLTEANGQLQSDLSAANATISNLNGQVTALTAQNAQLQSDLDAANATIAGLNSQIATLTTQNGQLQSDLDAANATIGSQATQIATLTAQNGQLQADLTAANATIGSLNGQITTLTAQNAQLQSDLSAANATIASQATQIAGLQGQVSSLTTLNAQLTAQLAIANQAVATCQADLASSTQAFASSVSMLTNAFRVSFKNPAFVIPGSSTASQINNVFNVILDLPNGQQRSIYRAMQ